MPGLTCLRHVRISSLLPFIALVVHARLLSPPLCRAPVSAAFYPAPRPASRRPVGVEAAAPPAGAILLSHVSITVLFYPIESLAAHVPMTELSLRQSGS